MCVIRVAIKMKTSAVKSLFSSTYPVFCGMNTWSTSSGVHILYEAINMRYIVDILEALMNR